MRTFLKIAITVVVLVGGFVSYLVLQPVSALQSRATSRPVAQPLKKSGAGLIIGEGENAWVRQFDEQGRLASRFRAAKWEPQKNGLVRVVRPEAELFLKADKGKPRPLVIITGDDGEVVVSSLPDAAHADATLGAKPGAPAPGGNAMGQMQAPSSGRLNGVVIRVFETEDAKEPAVTLKTNNIVFDNETFRISTETFNDPSGRAVAPDEVPVSVEGPYFDFYGRGLTVRWNDLEERLDLLRIAHGERLVIKDVEALGGDGSPFGAPAAGASRKRDNVQARLAAPTPATPPLLASADPAAAIALAAADAATSPATSTAAASRPSRRKEKSADKTDDQPPYRATFNDQVRVFQGDEQRALANLLNVDFLPGDKKDPATRPTTTTAPVPAVDPTTSHPLRTHSAPATAPSTHPSNPEPTPSPAASPVDSSHPAPAAPATAPSPQPITVYWTGEFTVTPAPATPHAEDPLPPGEARVELVGAPVVLTRELLDIRSARFAYRTDGRLSIDRSDQTPQVLITQRSAAGAPDTTVVTEKVEYDTRDKVATLRGVSRVTAPVSATAETSPEAAGTNVPPTLMHAAWRDAATFHLVGETESDMYVERADLAGDVDVSAPQGLVRAQRLELAFDAPAATGETHPFARGPTTLPATQPTSGPSTIPATTGRVPVPSSDLRLAGGLARRSADHSTRDDQSEPALATTVPTTAPTTRPATGPKDPSKPAGRSQPNLRRVVATEKVYCELIDAKKGKQTLECQRLALDTALTPDGDLYPRVIDASGAVHASAADELKTTGQDLEAGHVLLHLRPVTKAQSASTQPAGAGDPVALTPPKGEAAAGNPTATPDRGAKEAVATATPDVGAENAVAPATPDRGAQEGIATATTDRRAEEDGTTAAPDHGAKEHAATAAPGATVEEAVGTTNPPKVEVAANPAKDARPQFELESMVATDAVRVASNEGGAATGKRLEVTVAPDGHARIELSGDPAGVEDGKGGTLTGPRIVVDPQSGVAHVPGAGTLRAVQRSPNDAPDSPGQPLEVTWSDRADVKANDNHIEIAGAVSLWITDADGSVRNATAGRVRVELADKPADQVAADAAKKNGKDGQEEAAPQVQLAGAMQTDLFKNKEVAKVHMYDDAVVNSKLLADDGSVLQQYHLKSDAITYDARTMHLTVPGPGQLLVESHEDKANAAKKDEKDKGEKDKGEKDKGKEQPQALAAGNGATAFQWSTGLEYAGTGGRATMNGSVIVSHQPDDKKQPAIRLDADTVTATFVPSTDAKVAAAAQNASGDAGKGDAAKGDKAKGDTAKGNKPNGDGVKGGGPQLDLRSIVADGQVLISREGTELSARRVEFDPSTHWVVARGSERNPATFTHPSGVGTLRATELRLNTLTWTVQITDVNTRVGDLSR